MCIGCASSFDRKACGIRPTWAQLKSRPSYHARQRGARFLVHPQPGAQRAALLYREVLGVSLPWLDDIGRPKYVRRIPVVLTPPEVSRLIAVMDDELVRLLVRLL
jgi:hypothetical protein